MTGDMGDYFNEYREHRNEKRKRNTEHSTAMLKDAGVEFESNNGGSHLFVANRFDFWPSTGLFIERKTKRRGRGVRKLINEVTQ